MASAEAMLYQLKNLKGKPLKQKLEQVFTYYRIPILVVAAILGIVVAYAFCRLHHNPLLILKAASPGMRLSLGPQHQDTWILHIVHTVSSALKAGNKFSVID